MDRFENRLVKIPKGQIEVENEIADSINKGVADVTNHVIREILKGTYAISSSH